MAVLCPHGCGVTFDRDHATYNMRDIGPAQMVADEDSGGTVHHVWHARAMICPRCQRIVVELELRNSVSGGAKERHPVWPRPTGRPVAPEVPEDVAADYREASAILDLSARGSAALSRRALQHVLTDHLHATGRNLEQQIESVAAAVPSYITDGLQLLRQVGNFSAHPIKDELSGEIIDVELGEAEWSLDLLESLFDFVFVQPVRAQALKAAFNQKLQAAGKPLLT